MLSLDEVKDLINDTRLRKAVSLTISVKEEVAFRDSSKAELADGLGCPPGQVNYRPVWPPDTASGTRFVEFYWDPYSFVRELWLEGGPFNRSGPLVRYYPVPVPNDITMQWSVQGEERYAIYELAGLDFNRHRWIYSYSKQELAKWPPAEYKAS